MNGIPAITDHIPFKSSSFNRTVTMGPKDDEFMRYLLRKEFDSIPIGSYWAFEKLNQLIKIALNMGYTELASEMTRDLDSE